MAAVAAHRASAATFGLGTPDSWSPTIAYAIVWLGVMLAFSPLADSIGRRLVAKPPTLKAFRGLQESKLKLAIGIVAAWILGGFLEELIFRGIVLRSVEALMATWLVGPVSAAVAVIAAGGGAGVLHLYQGQRAAIIITQLSVLFGVLFVLSGYDLWAVMLCHGLYDTIAFIRFATKRSRYAEFAN